MKAHNTEKPITITRSEFEALGAQVIKEVCGEPDPEDKFKAIKAVMCGVVLGTVEHKLFDNDKDIGKEGEQL